MKMTKEQFEALYELIKALAHEVVGDALGRDTLLETRDRYEAANEVERLLVEREE